MIKVSKKRIAMIVCLMMMLAACGNKGDLYVPDDSTAAVVES